MYGHESSANSYFRFIYIIDNVALNYLWFRLCFRFREFALFMGSFFTADFKNVFPLRTKKNKTSEVINYDFSIFISQGKKTKQMTGKDITNK